MKVADYGVWVYRHGVVLHGDGRRRERLPGGYRVLVRTRSSAGRPRGTIRGFTKGSQRRLEFVAANIGAAFASLITLTYHAVQGEWESDGERNARVALRSKDDLNRFLSSMREELGGYLWVQEFQARGVIHYHILAEHQVEASQVATAWGRATDELCDADAVRHATKTEQIRAEQAARSYVGRYLGKVRQKQLPAGVNVAGRWWGRPHSLRLVLLEQVVSCPARGRRAVPEAARVVRGVRGFLRKMLRRKFRGGAIVDWRGELSQRLQSVVTLLRAFYGDAGSRGEAGTGEPLETAAGRAS